MFATRKLHRKRERATPPPERGPALEHTKEKEKTKQVRTTSQPTNQVASEAEQRKERNEEVPRHRLCSPPLFIGHRLMP
jgi:hypothetical protein